MYRTLWVGNNGIVYFSENQPTNILSGDAQVLPVDTSCPVAFAFWSGLTVDYDVNLGTGIGVHFVAGGPGALVITWTGFQDKINKLTATMTITRISEYGGSDEAAINIAYLNVVSMPKVVTVGMQNENGKELAIIANREDITPYLPQNSESVLCIVPVPAQTIIKFDVRINPNVWSYSPDSWINYATLKADGLPYQVVVRTPFKIKLIDNYKRSTVPEAPALLLPDWISVTPDRTLVGAITPVLVTGYRAQNTANLRVKISGYVDSCLGVAPGSSESSPVDANVAYVGPVTKMGAYRVCVLYRKDWEMTSTVMQVLPVGGCMIRAVVQVKDRPLQTSWRLQDKSTGQIISFGGVGDHLIPVPLGTYSFTVYDLSGDGLCCYTWNGGYEVYVDNQIAANGELFNRSISHNITCNRNEVYRGAHSCQGILNANPGYCGCYYERKQSNISQNAYQLTLDTPRWVMEKGDDDIIVRQGCCTKNTSTNVALRYIINSKETWGLCRE
eukprot:NODE_1572_length_1900_cov_56.016882_g1331_i0.p1 GENE.NODE_1572_length_1900_cov_56.016882_g1331_i0~~NODE_1572_length_1900_cov_56.016882_g1331_i0.p1  ORF type:complete len:589 (-),score=108.48 NODE_1572_length_1900_cov_56.016882_g1331_i0:134-1636(-)